MALSKLIAELAERVNYGIELDDLPNGLPEGVDEIPAVRYFPALYSLLSN